MNRMEMFLELKKDPSKMFTGFGVYYTVKEINGVQTIVYSAKISSFDDDYHITNCIAFEDATEYTEVIKPLWEVIEDGEWFYCIDFYCENGVSYDTFDGNYECDIRNKENHNMFRTEEEAKDKAKELLEILKK